MSDDENAFTLDDFRELVSAYRELARLDDEKTDVEKKDMERAIKFTASMLEFPDIIVTDKKDPELSNAIYAIVQPLFVKPDNATEAPYRLASKYAQRELDRAWALFKSKNGF